METNTILIFLGCMIGIFIIGKIFVIPIKSIIKLLLNSALGALLIFIINLIGGIFNFHIGINIFTAIFVGILGIPGASLLIIFKILI